MIRIETPRLIMSRMGAADAGFLVQLLNQPSFLQFIGDKGVRNEADALRYLREGPDATFDRHGFCLFRVALKDSDLPIGMCGLLKREQLEAPDIGFALLTAYEGKGYAAEAAHAVVAHAFQQLGLTRIVAIANQDNASSHRLLEKIGLRYQGLRNVYDGEAPLAFFAVDKP